MDVTEYGSCLEVSSLYWTLKNRFLV